MEIGIRDFVAEIAVECLDFDPAPLRSCQHSSGWIGLGVFRVTPRYRVNKAVVNPSCGSVRLVIGGCDQRDIPCPPTHSGDYSDQYL